MFSLALMCLLLYTLQIPHNAYTRAWRFLGETWWLLIFTPTCGFVIYITFDVVMYGEKEITL